MIAKIILHMIADSAGAGVLSKSNSLHDGSGSIYRIHVNGFPIPSASRKT
jgi:hypothetical protein